MDLLLRLLLSAQTSIYCLLEHRTIPWIYGIYEVLKGGTHLSSSSQCLSVSSEGCPMAPLCLQFLRGVV